jgi:hypothetical protein
MYNHFVVGSTYYAANYRSQPVDVNGGNRWGTCVDFRDTVARPLNYRTVKRNKIKRSRFLLTLQFINPKPTCNADKYLYRSFYTEYFIFG